MFPAHKQTAARPTDPAQASGSNPVGFGKVLSSIQGLQQRLEDFSVEDVARTEASAQALARKLAQLHAQLRDLDELKDRIVSANAQIAQIPEDNFAGIEPAGLEKYPALSALLQADALIRRHGLKRPEKSAPAPIVLEEFSDEIFVGSAAPDAGAPRERSEAEDWVLSSDHENDFPESARGTDFELGSLPAAEAPKPPTTAPVVEPTPPETAAPPRPSSGFDERLLNELIENYGEFTVLSAGAPVPTPAAPEPAVFASEAAAQPVVEEKPVKLSAPAEPEAPPAKAPIEAAAIEMPAPEELRQEDAPAAPVEVLPAVESAPEEVECRALIVPEPPKSKKEQREARANEKKLQTATKRGEIDRQLKSIIKDYGEYDLYSPPSTINFKLAAIGAFAVLALALGGLYFFKVPSVTRPAVVSTIEQPDGAKSPAANQPARK